MKAVRLLAVADASALPGLRRALSPESIELVGVASTPGSVLAQLRRVCPDVVVVDLSLSQTDVFQLITQLVQEHAALVLALASGEDAASLAERAHVAGASDVVERRTVAGSWHEESGSPHVLSLRVLSLAASARPRPSKLSLRVSQFPVPSSRVPPLSAAEAFGRLPDATPPTGLSREVTRSVRVSPPSSADLSRRSPDATSPAGLSSEVLSSVRASPLSAAEVARRAPGSLSPSAGSSREASPLSAADIAGRVPGSPRAGVSREVSSRSAPEVAGRAAASPSPPASSSSELLSSVRASPLSAAEVAGRAAGSPSPLAGSSREASPLSAADVAGRVPGPAGSSRELLSSVRASPLSASGVAGSAPGLPAAGVSPLPAAGLSRDAVSSRPASLLASSSSAAEPSDAPLSTRGLPHEVTSSVPAGGLSGSAHASRGAGAEAQPLAARMSGVPRSFASKTGRPPTAAQVELVAIGASTGGTLALAELLKTLPESAPPMLVVQHMLPEFTTDFAQRLNELCELQVRVAVDGELVKSGTVLLAPGGRHLRVMRDAEHRLRARVTDELPVGKHRPSVDVLFQACAETLGSAALGVLLTGMGDDGARGLLALHKSGARTLVQDQASSVCFGMPSAAIALGAAQQILPLQDIAHALRELIKKRSSVRA